MSQTTIVNLDGGPLHGRYDLSCQDTPPEVHRFARSVNRQGDRCEGYEYTGGGNFGCRVVLHGRAVQDVDRSIAAEERARRAARYRPLRHRAAGS